MQNPGRQAAHRKYVPSQQANQPKEGTVMTYNQPKVHYERIDHLVT